MRGSPGSSPLSIVSGHGLRIALCLLMAQSDVSLRRECLAAIGGEADMHARVASPASVAHDPGCVKTHTSAKCGKHNSPGGHRTSRVQYDLTLRDAIARRYFYVWRDRWSFRTAKTHSGHTPGRNCAVQRSATTPWRAIIHPLRLPQSVAAIGAGRHLRSGNRKF